MNDKVLSLLGLIRRANKLSFGYDTVLKSVKENKAELIIFTDDISRHSESDVAKAAEGERIRSIRTKYSKDDIETAIGKYSAVLSINDKGFAEKMISLLEISENKEEE